MKKMILFLFLAISTMPIYSQIPEWYTNPDRNSSYNSATYILGIGSGSTSELAEFNAYANLSSYFNLDIYSATLSVEEEQLAYGEIDNYYYGASATFTSSSAQNLKNVEVKERYRDSSSGIYYVLVTIHKKDTATMLVNMINKNNSLVKEYYSLAAKEKDNLRKYGLIGKAFLVAVQSEKLNELLQYLDYNKSAITHKASELIRQEAMDLAYSTTFALEINYQNSMFKQKLSRALNDMTMQIVDRGKTASYTIKEQMSYSGKTEFGSYVLNYDYRLLFINSQGKTIMTFDVVSNNIGDDEADALRSVNNEISREIEKRFKNEFIEFLNKSML